LGGGGQLALLARRSNLIEDKLINEEKLRKKKNQNRRAWQSRLVLKVEKGNERKEHCRRKTHFWANGESECMIFLTNVGRETKQETRWGRGSLRQS